MPRLPPGWNAPKSAPCTHARLARERGRLIKGSLRLPPKGAPLITFQHYLEQWALLSLEKRDRLLSLVGDHQYELNLDAGTIRINEFEFPMQVIGTESDNTLTWLWAWAEEQTEIPEGLLDASLQLRQWGMSQGLAEFTTPSIDLVRIDGSAIAMISAQVCKASCSFRDAYEGGAVHLLLFDRAIDSQPSFDRARLVQRLADVSSRYDLNHRGTLLSYLRLKGLSPLEQDGVISCELESGERLNAEFDAAGGLTMINGAAFIP